MQLEFQGGLIHDKTRTDGHDGFDFDQIIGAQGTATRDQIDNGVGQPDQRCQFHGTVQLDNIDVHTLGGKMFARRRDIFAGNANARPLAHRLCIIEVFACRYTHAAAGNTQVNRLIQAVAAVFQQDILTGNAQIGTAILHISRYIRGTHNYNPGIGICGGQYQFT